MKRTLLKDTAWYVFVNYVSLFLSTLRGILLINLLTPFSLGIYRLIFTYSSYFRYYNLGLNALAFYRAPLKGLQDSYALVIQRINTILSLSFGGVFALFFAYVWWGDLTQQSYTDIVLWLFLILVFTQLSETFLTTAKIHSKFKIINQYNLFFAVSSLVFMITMGFFWELRGVVLGLTISTILSCGFLMTKLGRRKKSAPSITWWKLKVLFKHGAITILPGMLIVLYSTIEVWLITYKYGVTETGYYSVVMTFVNLILMLNTDGLVYLYAKRSKQFKKDKSFVLKISTITFLIIMAVCFAGSFIVEWGVELFFPQYVLSSEIFKICYWGIPFLVFKNIVMYYISNSQSLKISVLLAALLLLKSVALYTIGPKDLFYLTVGVFNALFGVCLVIYFVRSSFVPNAQPKT